ncbi:peptide ABC transporter substrate-binding protein [Xenorhabdus bovienii]|uniref:peptide ABC transporter substrate-binding protein n=1 Tax=Xenorhabdus bovienii TaxID=40576 RepID=UPI002A5B1984|nr:peptide ABC transporter substrate-binding protein [Xenorhabdus bovienii]MDE9431906.1 peptide ABC transporter substrate-binding protein [Xenorhabdus bovienii]MDE9489632.1 peptide ABC transporter substrate-binding protein [Xenorhabdus bovienii]MDE9505676.1 peptide ABC transporter substrate-binding protein [Xenorhabdus bovienii]MDE9545805.1 peptide ABC transporter substrate-binding protein [Xenorhabdus bovienii]
MHNFKLLPSVLLMTGLSFSFSVSAANVPTGTQLDGRQELVRQLKDEPASLDPIKSFGLTEAQVLRDLLDGLVNQDVYGEPIPGVAIDWKTTDNQTWVFTLRQNAHWSNGDKVTASDFVYSWRRLVNPANASSFSWFAALSGIQNAQEIIDGKLPSEKLGVEAIDPYTLKVSLDRPVPYFPNMTTNFSLYPVHKQSIEKYGNDWTRVGHLVGNGAFMLTGRVVNEKIVLTPNPYYWDHKNTVLKKVTFLPINQESHATKRYLAGDLDITESFPKNMYQKLLRDIPGEVFTPDQLGTYYYAFNTQRAPTNDIRVRRALSMTIDRKLIAGKILGTGEKPAWRFTPDVTAGFQPEKSRQEILTQQELDNQARTLLKEAGYGFDNPLKLSLLYNNLENNQRIAIAISSEWKKKLGVEVKLVNQEWKTYVDNRNTGNFDVVRASWTGDYNEPSSFLSLLTSTHSGNLAKFHNSAYDTLLKEASQETDEMARNRDYNQAEKIITEQAPIAPIYQYTNGRLIKSWLKGYPITNPEDVAYSHSMYIIKH